MPVFNSRCLAAAALSLLLAAAQTALPANAAVATQALAGAGHLQAAPRVLSTKDRVADLFPWTCRQKTMTSMRTQPDKELEGEWISSLEPSRVLDIRDGRFSLQGTGRNLRGTVTQEGPELVFTLDDQLSCRVIWQLLGDGRLAINSGQDLLHRRGEPAIPTTSVRQFGHKDCRFTVTVPSVLPMEETEDGVRIMSIEKDAAMQILSGVTDKSCHDFAKAIATALGSTDFQAVDKDANAYTFTATVRGIPMMQYIVMEGKQYLHVSLMGQYNKLVSYLKYVHIVDTAR